jgi:hypothetical protein
MNRGSLSLLIPVFNHEKYLPELFRSVDKQSRTPDEILVSDDGSEDGSVRLVESWAQRRQKTRFFSQKKNLGITENSNFLIRQAKGDYVMTLHSDDCLGDIQALEKMAGVLDQDPSIALVTSLRQRIDGQSRELNVEAPLQPGRYPRDGVLRRILTTEANPVGEPSAVIFRKAALPSGFDSSYRQLWDLWGWLEILKRGDLAVMDQPLVRIREHAAQATRRHAQVGQGIVEHLRLFGILLGEADRVLARREKSILLHKLSQTASRHRSRLSPEAEKSLREAKAGIPGWIYLWDLCHHRLERLRNPGLPSLPKGHAPAST